MKTALLGILIPFLIGIPFSRVSAQETEGRAVQIAVPVNHTFNLELNELKTILENENIKDRHVAVVSIAGAFRQGKSFLLNFFIKYLNAQYKKHDITDWIGEQSGNSGLNGFKFRGGRKPETIGIWIWSDVFTYDFPNGEKVAIILLDTQGIFDSRSSIHDYTTIFSLSMMLSSVQCYNLMQNIREDDLQHLELFTEYGRLAMEQTNEKPFQKLVFIVRDWPYAFETNYGWDGQKVVDDFLHENDDQTPEMRTLRTRIKTSFEQIQAFLMPHPGFAVAQANNFTGNVQSISSEFRKYVQELVPGLFAPEKLIVKKINGEKVRVRDLIPYLQTYVNVFNGDTLPAPKTVLMATAEASYQIHYGDALNHYVDSMQKAIREVQSFFSVEDLNRVHQIVKNESVSQLLAKPKLGGEQLATSFKQKIESATEEKFTTVFKAENERKRLDFIQKANLHNEKTVDEINAVARKKVHTHIEGSSPDLKMSDLSNVFNIAKQAALEEFDKRKMGNAEISNSFRVKLTQLLDTFLSTLSKTIETFVGCQAHYSNSVQSSLDQVEYLRQDDFVNLHQRVKAEAIAQFVAQSQIDAEIKFGVQRKLDQIIDATLPSFDQKNQAKHNNYIERANAHNNNICNEIRAAFENSVRGAIGGAYRSDGDFINLFIGSKQSSLEQFAARKMGEGDISNAFRERLEREIDALQAALKQANDANKPKPKKKKRKWYHIG